MILPTKHISFAESLFGLGGFLLKLIDKPLTIDDVWYKFSEANKNFKLLPAYHNFENVILALDYLFLIGAININTEEKIYHEINRT